MQQGTKTVGHPVNVATGTVYSTHEDISIPGKVDLVWERRYSTALLDNPPSPLGPGWTTRYFATLTRGEAEFRFLSPEGETEIFADPEGKVDKGGIVRNLGTFQELAKRKNEYVVTRWDVETGKIERYVFKAGRKGEAWPLASIDDVTGQGVDLLRDKTGRLTGIQQRLEKRTLIIDYTRSNQIQSISFLLPSNKRQILARYEYDKSGRLSAAYNALGHADRYEYDANGRMTREIVKDGGVFFFKYDEQGRCIKTSGLDRYDEKTFRYFDYGWTEVTNSYGHVTRFQWLPNGQIVSEIDSLGGTKKTEYDEYGRIIAKSDPNEAVTKYEYDKEGNRCRIIDPLVQEILFTFNQHHQTLTLTDPAGNVWKSTYDSFNRWVAIVDPLGIQWTFIYDRQGNLIQVTDPKGSSRKVQFSPNGQLLETTDCLGNPTRYVEDYFGNLIQRTDPSGKVVNFHYDLLGRLLQIKSSDDSQASLKYDAGGNMTELIDSNGYSTKFRYGSCRRLLERIDPLGRIQKFIWGSEPDRLEMIINEKEEIYTFVYDDAGRVIEETGFDGIKLAFKYDMAGYCVATINGLGEECFYTRNKLGRLIKKTLSDGTVCSFAYDILGNLISAVNPSCKVQFERDPLGRVIKENQGDFIIENEYDAVGNLIVTKTSQGHNIRYTFNNNRLLLSLTAGDKTWQFRRDTEGREISRRLPGGISLEQQHNLVGQLATQHVSLPEEIIRRAYHYDKSGNLTMLEDSRWGNTQYMYDPAERIIQAIREKDSTEHFSYDSTGNITQVRAIKTSDDNSTGIEIAKDNSINSSSSAEEVLEYGRGNRLLRRGNTKYFYDDNGRIIKKVKNSESANPEEWNFSWNADNQLVSITKPDGNVWKYTYDPFGRRISKQGPKGGTQFVWYQDVIIHQFKDQTLESTWIFDPHSLKPLCKLQGDSTYSVITDQLGTPKELVDDRGKVVWVAKAKTWGEIERIEANEKVDCPIHFQGQWHDDESGLFYNRFRYYDPENGRFISRDPIGLLGGLNEYVYTPNPINWIDPLGLIPVYRNIRSEESSAAGLQARRPGRGMSPAGHIMNGSRHNGSQFISTTTDPAVAARWREPGQVTVRFDTNAVVPDSQGNLRIVNVSTPEQAQAEGLRGRAYSNAVASSEVLVEGRVPAAAMEEVDPEQC